MLLEMGAKAVLMKGGHGDGPVCTDYLVNRIGDLAYPPQRIDTKNTHGTGCTFSSAIAAELAKGVAMSTRQLERLFRRYLNRSPKRYYMELRLEKARNLLLQTDMSVINVALACGFTSPSHFSKCYRNHFQRTPYRERGTPAEQRARA